MSICRKVHCRVEAIIDHGDDVYTLDLKPDSRVPKFQPGQFLHLSVDDYNPASFWPESRVFSVASSPHERERLCICYSVKGQYTEKMKKSLHVGRDVWVKLPYGDFFIDETRAAVLIAGGTGISAFIAFVEALAPDTAHAVTLLYGARNPALFLFHDMLRQQDSAVLNFNTFLFSEAPKGPAVSGVDVNFRGRISLDAVWSHFGKTSDTVFYLAGPPIMQEVLGRELQGRGVSTERIRIDAWE
jgi:NAD(P)H-flavin reductase